MVSWVPLGLFMKWLLGWGSDSCWPQCNNLIGGRTPAAVHAGKNPRMHMGGIKGASFSPCGICFDEK